MENIMDAMTNLLTRRSVRKYKPDAVPKEIIEKVVNAGLYAANTRGKQPTIIVAVTDKETRDKLSEANREIGGWEEGFDPFYGAPAVLIVLTEKSFANRVYDGSCVMENLMLACHSFGLGSCWIHRAREEFEKPQWQQWLRSLGVEGEYEGIGHCIVGYVDGEYPEAAPRNPNRAFYVV